MLFQEKTTNDIFGCECQKENEKVFYQFYWVVKVYFVAFLNIGQADR